MEQILQTIRYNDGKFPREALQQLIEHKEEAIPYLLQIMNELKEDYKKVIDHPSRIDFIYAYYLLAQFQVKEFFPTMVELLSLPSDICDDIFGDVLTEDTARILASLYNDHVDLLMGLIENAEANEYARGQALIALVILVMHGKLSREFVMDYFKQLMNGRLSDANYYVNAELVCCCNDLYPEEVYTDIQHLYENQVVETFIIGIDNIDRTLEKTKEEVLQSNRDSYKFKPITDVIHELEGWACFHQERYKPGATSFSKKNRSSVKGEPKRNPAVKVEKVGRNDPCICGSGKKYKKCCGN